MYISSMLDGNKEIPIRIKNNNIESKEINQTLSLSDTWKKWIRICGKFFRH